MKLLIITGAIASVLLGLYLLYRAFVLVFKVFRARVLEKVSLNALPLRFNMKQTMTIAIWLEGPIGQRLPEDFSKPSIVEFSTGREIKLQHSIGRASKNSFSHARTLLFYADLAEGEYQLIQSDQPLVSPVEEKVSTAIQRSLNLSTAKSSQCCILLTEALSRHQRLSMIVFVFLGVFALMTGILKLFEQCLATTL